MKIRLGEDKALRIRNTHIYTVRVTFENGLTLVVTVVTGLLDLASQTRTVLSPEAANAPIVIHSGDTLNRVFEWRMHRIKLQVKPSKFAHLVKAALPTLVDGTPYSTSKQVPVMILQHYLQAMWLDGRSLCMNEFFYFIKSYIHRNPLSAKSPDLDSWIRNNGQEISCNLGYYRAAQKAVIIYNFKYNKFLCFLTGNALLSGGPSPFTPLMWLHRPKVEHGTFFRADR